jgi:hypothetical protein
VAASDEVGHKDDGGGGVAGGCRKVGQFIFEDGIEGTLGTC